MNCYSRKLCTIELNVIMSDSEILNSCWNVKLWTFKFAVLKVLSVFSRHSEMEMNRWIENKDK